MKITLEQWRLFKAVADHGGFNQAAQAIFKSQSSIHTAVGKLEQTLGVKLFKVEGRKTTLTPAGELMCRRAASLLEEAARLEAVGTHLAEGVETSLNIAVDEIFPTHLLYQVLERVSSQYPLVRIELIETILSGALELVENDLADIAISPVTKVSIFSEALCNIPFVAVASPNHPLNQIEETIPIEVLKSHRQIVVRDSSQIKKEDAGWLEAEQRWTVSHLRTSIDMIIAGLGFAWLPEPFIQDALKAGTLSPLNLAAGQSRSSQLHLLFADGDSLGPVARTFLGELRLACLALESP